MYSLGVLWEFVNFMGEAHPSFLLVQSANHTKDIKPRSNLLLATSCPAQVLGQIIMVGLPYLRYIISYYYLRIKPWCHVSKKNGFPEIHPVVWIARLVSWANHNIFQHQHPQTKRWITNRRGPCGTASFLGAAWGSHILYNFRIATSTTVLPIIFIISWELKWLRRLRWTCHVSRGNFNLEFIITSPSGGDRNACILLRSTAISVSQRCCSWHPCYYGKNIVNQLLHDNFGIIMG